MKQKKITPKDCQMAIKRGLTPEQFAEEHGIELEELKNQIRMLYKAGDGSRAQVIYGQLEANRKKAHCRGRKPKNLDLINVEHNGTIKIKSGKTAIVKPTEPEMPEVSETPEKSQAEQPSKNTILESLKAEEASLCEETMAIEINRNELLGELRSRRTTLRELQEEMEKIQKRLDDCSCKYNETAIQADELMKQLREIAEIKREKTEALEKVRQSISDMTAIVICVYNDGTIEAQENPDFAIIDEGYQELKNGIAEREECLDLRVRDITTLARLIKICEKVEGQLTLVCDVPELEKAFWAIRS